MEFLNNMMKMANYYMKKNINKVKYGMQKNMIKIIIL